MAGNYAYVADKSGGLQIIGLDSGQNPYRIANYDTFGDANDIYVANGYAYVVCSATKYQPDKTNGLQIIDIRNPQNPSYAGSYETIAYRVYVANNYAYLGKNGSLSILDISDPTQPNEIGSCSVSSGAVSDIYVKDNYAYVSAGNGYFYLINVSEERVWQTIAALRELGVQRLGLCHCTDLPAASVMAQEFGENFFFNKAGTVINLP